MAKPMTEERLAELEEYAKFGPAVAAPYVRELVAEVRRLQGEVQRIRGAAYESGQDAQSRMSKIYFILEGNE